VAAMYLNALPKALHSLEHAVELAKKLRGKSAHLHLSKHFRRSAGLVVPRHVSGVGVAVWMGLFGGGRVWCRI